MSVLVVGSVVVYSFFLPQTAPKQITLGVIPFTEAEEFTPTSVGFTAALRDSLALSRDIALVDNISTMTVAWDKERVNDLAGVLALTHFVDGNIQINSSSSLTTVEYRVVNVTHPNWQEVRRGKIEVDENEERPYQSARDQLTISIRESLYDNSEMRTESQVFAPDVYLSWLLGIGNSVLKTTANEVSYDEKITQYQLDIKDLYDETKVSPEMYRLFWEISDRFSEQGSIASFKQELWHQVGEYPNSPGLSQLAQLYMDLGATNTAEKLWLRAARIRSQSAEVAFRIADANWRQGQFDKAKLAIRIATQRSQSSSLVDCLQRQFSQVQLPNEEALVSDGEDATACTKLANSYLSDRTRRDVVFYVSEYASMPDSFSAVGNYIGAAPMFVADTDPKWLRWQEFLQQKGYRLTSELSLTLESSDDVDQLLAPRRPD